MEANMKYAAVIGLILNVIGAIIIAGAQSRLFTVVNTWLNALDFFVETYLQQGAPICSVYGPRQTDGNRASQEPTRFGAWMDTHYCRRGAPNPGGDSVLNSKPPTTKLVDIIFLMRTCAEHWTQDYPQGNARIVALPVHALMP